MYGNERPIVKPYSGSLKVFYDHNGQETFYADGFVTRKYYHEKGYHTLKSIIKTNGDCTFYDPEGFVVSSGRECTWSNIYDPDRKIHNYPSSQIDKNVINYNKGIAANNKKTKAEEWESNLKLVSKLIRDTEDQIHILPEERDSDDDASSSDIESKKSSYSSNMITLLSSDEMRNLSLDDITKSLDSIIEKSRKRTIRKNGNVDSDENAFTMFVKECMIPDDYALFSINEVLLNFEPYCRKHGLDVKLPEGGPDGMIRAIKKVPGFANVDRRIIANQVFSPFDCCGAKFKKGD